MSIFLRSGELIPKESRVIVVFGNETKEFRLSELVDVSDVSGDFFIDGINVSGSGAGYGVLGSKIIYPEIYFDVLVNLREMGEL